MLHDRMTDKFRNVLHFIKKSLEKIENFLKVHIMFFYVRTPLALIPFKRVKLHSLSVKAI